MRYIVELEWEITSRPRYLADFHSFLRVSESDREKKSIRIFRKTTFIWDYYILNINIINI